MVGGGGNAAMTVCGWGGGNAAMTVCGWGGGECCNDCVWLWGGGGMLQ